jgi:hypothetical protein
MGYTAEYLKQMVILREQMRPPNLVTKYSCFEAFILKEGKEFTYRSRPSNIKKMPDRHCYKNAFDLCLENHLTYVEGFATAVIPVQHAWCVDSDGFVIDPTWNDGQDYIGVALPKELVIATVFRRETHGVIDDWQHEWPILRLGLSEVIELFKEGRFDEIFGEEKKRGERSKIRA